MKTQTGGRIKIFGVEAVFGVKAPAVEVKRNCPECVGAAVAKACAERDYDAVARRIMALSFRTLIDAIRFVKEATGAVYVDRGPLIGYLAIPFRTAAKLVDIRKDGYIIYRGYVYVGYGKVWEVVRNLIVQHIVRICNDLREEIQTTAEINGFAQEKRAKRGMPPCIAEIMRRLEAGEHLPHHARFALAAYLINAGWDVDDVAKLFTALPDYNEKKTLYQVRHIAGLVGGKKKYSAPSCKKMKTWGLCVANCGVRSPLEY